MRGMAMLVRSVVVVLALLAMAAPALAGGWATVRLDAPPGEVVAGVPWRFGFVVKQHDVTPTNDVAPVIVARHRATGEELRGGAAPEGPVGHFVAELTFPAAGEWKWEIAPEPFAATSFETLRIAANPAALPQAEAAIHDGTCGERGAVAFALGGLSAPDPAEAPARLPVIVGEAMVDVPLRDLVAEERVVGIDRGSGATAAIACGDLDLGAAPVGDELVVGLGSENGSGEVGVAVLRAEGERTAVSLYLIAPPADVAAPVAGGPEVEAAPVAGAAVEKAVEILDAGFFPTTLTVPAGTTVAWSNASAIAHTVTGRDLAFADSAPLDPGQTFRQTFTEPGRYAYRCGPHPWMAGEVVVE